MGDTQHRSPPRTTPALPLVVLDLVFGDESTKNFFQFGAASAMAWVLFALIAVFSLIQFRVLRGHTEF